MLCVLVPACGSTAANDVADSGTSNVPLDGGAGSDGSTVDAADPADAGHVVTLADGGTDDGGDAAVVARSVKWESTAGRTFVTVSADGLTATKNDGAAAVRRSVYGDILLGAGSWYFEATVASFLSAEHLLRIGLASEDGRVPDDVPTAAWSYSMSFDGSFVTVLNGVYAATPVRGNLAVGDVIGVSFDLTTLSAKFFVNGTLVRTQALQGGRKYSPLFFGSNNSNGSATANFGKTAFAYSPGGVFKPLDNTGP